MDTKIIQTSGFRELTPAELDAVSGGQGVWSVIREFFKGFSTGAGEEAASAAIDAATNQNGTTQDEMLQREKAINPQFNPLAESKDFTFTKTNGEKVHGKYQDGRLFMDSDGNKAFDSVSVIGSDGRMYIDTGDGRGFVGYFPGSEPWSLTNKTANVGLLP